MQSLVCGDWGDGYYRGRGVNPLLRVCVVCCDFTSKPICIFVAATLCRDRVFEIQSRVCKE
ncbi:hypothetical protein PPIS_a0039 [Pseudoalteromonas piscicida]|uniref:Uncharacterized protein n=1 Tax=Pseudoalteromonas piscicida TaxID=43662 RepID=A0ABM6N9J1_PSEO7|nr:hypothetical protein PPIS_a0039 [Pseudoalteromonas piscicida]